MAEFSTGSAAQPQCTTLNSFIPVAQSCELVTAGIGKVVVQVPRAGDRGAERDGRIRFRSSIVPPWLRKAKPVEELALRLCLMGLSTGDFGKALAALLGPNAEGLSASAVARLKASRAEDCDSWRRKDLSSRRFVHACANGVHFTPRLDGDRQCMPVLIGADEFGDKDNLAVMDGFRGNADSWREQRCRVHEAANVNGAMPKSLHDRAGSDLHGNLLLAFGLS